MEQINKAKIKKGRLPYLTGFVLLQLLLFIPLWLTRMDEGTFYYTFQKFPQSLVSRNNPDIFRWSLDYAIGLVICLMAYTPGRKKLITWLITFLYFLLFVFQCYYFILWKIYGEIPIFSYDFALFERVLPVFIKTMGISPTLFYTGLLVIASVCFGVIYTFHKWCLTGIHPWNLRFVFTFTFFYFTAPFLFRVVYGHPQESNHTKSSIVWIVENIAFTFTQDRVIKLSDTLNTSDYHQYLNLSLKSKPNILLIFIEAYGTVAGAVAPYDSTYRHQLSIFEQHVKQQGWHAVSTLSNSTILAGRSWLGFTTLLSGVAINNHPAYEKLLSRYPDFPHLVRLLNTNGYHTYRLNTMANYGRDFRVIDSIADTYFDFETWTSYNNIPYQGYRYDYFGGIPDQYALNFWEEEVLDKKDKPYFLFTITLNTHAPFYLPPPLVQNWRDLDAIKTSPHKSTRKQIGKPIERYSKEVIYILHVLQKFILEKVEDNTLVILVGDHQPAGMEYMLNSKTDIYATPMHILCKDSTWTTLFLKNGFESGMVPTFKQQSLLHHEGFYSYLMHLWSTHDSLAAVMPYRPLGIK